MDKPPAIILAILLWVIPPLAMFKSGGYLLARSRVAKMLRMCALALFMLGILLKSLGFFNVKFLIAMALPMWQLLLVDLYYFIINKLLERNPEDIVFDAGEGKALDRTLALVMFMLGSGLPAVYFK